MSAKTTPSTAATTQTLALTTGMLRLLKSNFTLKMKEEQTKLDPTGLAP